jgi:hypothetical protein
VTTPANTTTTTTTTTTSQDQAIRILAGAPGACAVTVAPGAAGSPEGAVATVRPLLQIALAGLPGAQAERLLAVVAA